MNFIFTWKNRDPNAKLLGGSVENDEGVKAVSNSMNAIAFTGKLSWILSQSGSYLGPKELKQGNYESQSLALEYSVSPGDARGYYAQEGDENNTSPLHVSKRSEKNQAKAFAFHENFKPALILFNPRDDLSNLNIDGVFNADRR